MIGIHDMLARSRDLKTPHLAASYGESENRPFQHHYLSPS